MTAVVPGCMHGNARCSRRLARPGLLRRRCAVAGAARDGTHRWVAYWVARSAPIPEHGGTTSHPTGGAARGDGVVASARHAAVYDCATALGHRGLRCSASGTHLRPLRRSQPRTALRAWAAGVLA